MKAYNAKYKYGFLYDVETGKRILLAEGSQLTVTIAENDVLKQDPYNSSNAIIKKDRILTDLKLKGFKEAILLKKEGESLFFEISAGFRSKALEPIKCIFELKLQEDLLGARKFSDKDYDLIECHCVVITCISDNLEFFEPIYAYSLNDAYSKTYDFYFRLYGKQAANVKERMMDEIGKDPKFLKSRLNQSKSSDFVI